MVDQANTSGLDAAQAQALEGYVEAGGTLVVAAGLDWQAVTAGLPTSLLPVKVTGTGSTRLTHLASLLGASPLGVPVDFDRVRLADGGVVLVTEGRAPLVVELSRGNGRVLFCAVDPAAAPLSTWAGDQVLLSRLVAPAYQGSYYGQAGPAVSGPAPTVSRAPPVSATSALGPGRTALLSPTVDASALATYLQELLAEDPGAGHFPGLLLLCYFGVAGPVCYLAVRRLRRRKHARVMAPCLAAAGGLLAYLVGVAGDQSATYREVQVALLAPGTHIAEVTSVGAAYLPAGGSGRAVLRPPGLVTGLGAGKDAQLTVNRAGGAVTLAMSGPGRSVSGWAASSDARIKGTVTARVQESAASLNGTVVNHLGVELTDAYVVSGWGGVASIGTVPPGASGRFDLPASSTEEAFAVGFPATLSSPLLSMTEPKGSSAARRQAAVEGLYDLASAYSGTNGPGPILVAFAHGQLLRPDTEAPAGIERATAVVVPLTPSAAAGRSIAGLAPELVGARRPVAGISAGGVAGSLVLVDGGYFDYQFVLPGTAWKDLTLDLGSLSGAAPGPTSAGEPGLGLVGKGPSGPAASPAALADFSLSTFNYGTARWDLLQVTYSSGHLVAKVPRPAAHIGPGGAVEVRLTARRGGLGVFGAVPALAAAPAGAGVAGAHLAGAHLAGPTGAVAYRAPGSPGAPNQQATRSTGSAGAAKRKLRGTEPDWRAPVQPANRRLASRH
ncbi:MAG: hypothetical protein ACRDZX_08560 [Acidimicrobiales bacterium]